MCSFNEAPQSCKDGIGNIWSATSQLSLFLSQFVTRDKQILEAVRRYARASLAIIFLKRRYGAERLSEKLDILISDGILLEDEAGLFVLQPLYFRRADP